MFTGIRLAVLLLTLGVIAAESKSERTDCYGYPLPEGAIARMGTVRGRMPGLVEACVFSHDGKILVAVGGDAAIHLFDADTLRPLRQLQAQKQALACLSFSSDGKILASGSKDGTVCLWDWPSGKVLRQFPAHKGGIRSLAFAGMGKFLASRGEDKCIGLWEPATGRKLRRYEGHDDAVTVVAVSPDGRFVASGSQSFFGHMRLWDADSGRLLQQQKAEGDWIQSLAFSPDGKLVALPAGICNAALWDVASGKIVQKLIGKRNGCYLSTLAFSPDGRSVAAAAADKCLFLWDISTGKTLHQLPGSKSIRSPGGITCLAFSPDGRRLAFGEDHCLRVWNVTLWRDVFPLDGHTDRIYRLSFAPDDRSLITASDDTANPIQERDVATGKKLRVLLHKRLIGRNAFQLSPDHTVLTSVDTDADHLLILSQNTATGKVIRRTKVPFDHEGGYHPKMIVLSPNGTIITNEYREKGDFRNLGVLLRDTTTGKELGKLSSDCDWFSFSPDSCTVACAKRKQIDLYNVPRSRITWELPCQGRGECVRSLAFSPDSRLVAVFTALSREYSPFSPNEPSYFRLYLWETTTQQKRAAWEISPDYYFSPAISHDGSLVAAGDSKGAIHLWSLSSGKEIRRLKGHRGQIESLAFSHDGKLLASGGSDTTALIWDIREVAEVARPHSIDVPRERLEQLWADLAGNDGERVHRAIWGLVAARRGVQWLWEHVKPVPPADEKRIAKLIADLDSDTFAVREKATLELEATSEAAEPALRKALASKPTLELRRRVEPIVKKLEKWPASSSAALLEWRALEVLEHLGTPEARQLLQKLAEGAPEARLTREAKAVLERLATRRDTMP
jgi:WD40 repeat protein